MYINQSIYQKLDTVCAEYGAQWIAVTKLRPVAALEELYAIGKRSFGENKAQELCDKYELLPKDIDWHFIGHLQTNKVKQIIDKVSTIHSVDSLKLLNEIQKEAHKINKKVAIFLQMHVAQEETKYGFSPEEMLDFFDQFQAEKYPNISIQGLMAMATFTDNKSQIEEEFNRVKTTMSVINSKYNILLRELSIGMSGDYEIALKCGGTRLRIGRILFN
jgi:pyridoxal phosphate enzyme (YggS family)